VNRYENVNIQESANIVIDINDRFEAFGTFYAPLGTNLVIAP
jgi:hypothetical protein